MTGLVARACPTLESVLDADKVQIGRWLRFLPSPENEAQRAILDAMAQRFKALGGWDPTTSKTVGWDPATSKTVGWDP
jgi:hypothetical protein